jgi:hypothetical protein
VKKDLHVWANFLLEDGGHPLCGHYTAPPIAHIELVSDAAGCHHSENAKGRIRCGNIGFNFRGEIIFAHQFWWPDDVIRHARDRHGSRMGDKTTTLEFFGLILPFLIIPKTLANAHIVVKVDNAACFFGWINKQSPNDEMASILIRSLHLIATYLGCQVHIQHLPRLSNWEAQVVDRLSREDTTTMADRKLVKSFQGYKVPLALKKWCESPVEDWDLPIRLLESVIEICEI